MLFPPPLHKIIKSCKIWSTSRNIHKFINSHHVQFVRHLSDCDSLILKVHFSLSKSIILYNLGLQIFHYFKAVQHLAGGPRLSSSNPACWLQPDFCASFQRKAWKHTDLPSEPSHGPGSRRRPTSCATSGWENTACRAPGTPGANGESAAVNRADVEADNPELVHVPFHTKARVASRISCILFCNKTIWVQFWAQI